MTNTVYMYVNYVTLRSPHISILASFPGFPPGMRKARECIATHSVGTWQNGDYTTLQKVRDQHQHESLAYSWILFMQFAFQVLHVYACVLCIYNIYSVYCSIYIVCVLYVPHWQSVYGAVADAHACKKHHKAMCMYIPDMWSLSPSYMNACVCTWFTIH